MTTKPSPKPTLALSLQFADASHRDLLPRHKVARWLRAALAAPAEITVRIVDADESRSLNRDYRARDYATNVLSFVYSDRPPLTGDIAICAPVVAREAREHGISREAHYAHLTVHGMLHLQGHDHRRAREAERMERLETRIMKKLGYADPYQRKR